MPYDVDHAERKEWKAGEGADHRRNPVRQRRQRSQALREPYAEAVERSSEHFLAGFLGELDALGLRDDTALAFVADHGESWGERFADKSDVKGTYHMHGATLFEEIVDVPLILARPGVDAGTVVDSTGEPRRPHADAARLRGRSDRRDRRQSRSLSPPRGAAERDLWIAGTDAGADLTALASAADPWKLIVHVESGEEEAYRLDTDPREQHSVPDDAPADLRDVLYAELGVLEQPEVSAEDDGARRSPRSPTSAISNEAGRDAVTAKAATERETRRALLRADVSHPAVRGDAPRPVRAGRDLGTTAHVHRPGGGRGRRHLQPRSGARCRRFATTAATATTWR